MPEETRQDAKKRSRALQARRKLAAERRTAQQTYQARYEAALKRAEDVFDSKEKAERWMKKRIPALGKQTPADAVKSEEGFGEVMDTLIRIEYGVYA
jgi:putative toxin-antitoxin system antitoxin component (TIGR02293 family)